MNYRHSLAIPLILFAFLVGEDYCNADSEMAYLDRQIEQQPNRQQPYIQRGSAYLNEGEFDEALQDFTKAAKLGDAANVDQHFGYYYFDKGNFAMAKRYLDRHLAKHPDDVYPLEKRAQALRELKELKASVADYRKVVQLKAQPDPGDYISIAEMIEDMADEGPAAALQILDAGLARLRQAPQIQLKAIELETKLQHFPQAIQRQISLGAALQYSPLWQAGLADLYRSSGNGVEAAANYRKALTALQRLRSSPAREALKTRVAAALAQLEQAPSKSAEDTSATLQAPPLAVSQAN